MTTNGESVLSCLPGKALELLQMLKRRKQQENSHSASNSHIDYGNSGGWTSQEDEQRHSSFLKWNPYSKERASSPSGSNERKGEWVQNDQNHLRKKVVSVVQLFNQFNRVNASDDSLTHPLPTRRGRLWTTTPFALSALIQPCLPSSLE